MTLTHCIVGPVPVDTRVTFRNGKLFLSLKEPVEVSWAALKRTVKRKRPPTLELPPEKEDDVAVPVRCASPGYVPTSLAEERLTVTVAPNDLSQYQPTSAQHATDGDKMLRDLAARARAWTKKRARQQEDDEVQLVAERTVEGRNAQGFAHAICIH